MDVEAGITGPDLAPRFRLWLATLVGLAAISAATLAWPRPGPARKATWR